MHFLLLFYRQAYSAVTDFSFYRTIFEQPLRRTLLYLLYLAVHVAAVLTLSLAWHGPELFEISNWAEENFPPLQIRDGQLFVESEQPLVKKYPGKQLITFVFDTTGTYEDPQQLEEPSMLFTREKLYLSIPGQTLTFLWSEWPFPEVEDVTRFVKRAYFPSAYSLIFFSTLLVGGPWALILTSIGFLATARSDIRLPFQQYFTIALYSLTPAIVIDVAVRITGLEVPLFPFLLITAAIYTYLATYQCVVVE
ncbi:MAG: DUF1189 family protein [Candidatus Hydrothermarchaeaceae archaeon]